MHLESDAVTCSTTHRVYQLHEQVTTHKPLVTRFLPMAILLAINITTYGQADSNRDQLQQAVTEISQGRLSQAESILNSVLASHPRNADALNLLGVVRAQQQRPAMAEDLFRRALSASPTHVGAHLNLGELLLTTNRTAEALPVLLKGHALAPQHPQINIALARLYEQQEKYDLALKHLRYVPQTEASVDYYPLLLKSLLKLNRLDEARQVADEFGRSGLRDPDIQAQLAMLLYAARLKEDAQALLEAALVQSPKSLALLHAAGVVYGAEKQYQKAEEFLNQALRVNPDDVMTIPENGYGFEIINSTFPKVRS